MVTEQNKALIGRFVEELFNRGNMSLVNEIFAPDFVEHEDLPPGIPDGRDGVKTLTTCCAAPSQISKPPLRTSLPKATRW